MSEDAATARALLSQKLDDLSCDVREGFADTKNSFAATNARLDRMNGTQQGHTVQITTLTARTEALERFRDMAVRSLLSGLGVGVGGALTLGGIVFGIGKAAGWW